MADLDDVSGATARISGARKSTPPASAVVPEPTEQGTAALRERARMEGHRAGFEAGRIDGLNAGRIAAAEEARKLAISLAEAISRFDAGVAAIEQDVANEVLALALEVARKVVDQSLAVQPDLVLGTIRTALAQMPVQHAVIHLNAEDAALVRQHAGEQFARGGHRIQEDPQLGRGDVVIDAGGTHLDCRVGTRWQRVIATLDQGTPWIASDAMQSS